MTKAGVVHDPCGREHIFSPKYTVMYLQEQRIFETGNLVREFMILIKIGSSPILAMSPSERAATSSAQSISMGFVVSLMVHVHPPA